MDKYKVIGPVTCGAHGVILEAVMREDRHRRLAVKRILISKKLQTEDTIPENVRREIECLNKLKDQEFVIQLLDVCRSNNSINLIFPFMPSNLNNLIYGDKELNSYHKLSLVFMLVSAVRVMHSMHLMHRDLKPLNCLIDWNGCLKVCDFGQSRSLSSESNLYSHNVSTRSYRPPELLYASTKYGPEVDMWSTGCIIAEIHMKSVLFTSDSDIGHLSLVTRCLGQVDENWAKQFPDYGKISFDFDDEQLKQSKRMFRQNIRERVDNEQISDLIFSLVRYTNRDTAEDVLRNPLFHGVRKNGIKYDLLMKPDEVNHSVSPQCFQ